MRLNKVLSRTSFLYQTNHKLMKQSFAIAKSGNPYDEKYVSILPK
jgi:transposase